MSITAIYQNGYLIRTEPPKDYSVETILSWLQSIKNAPDVDAVHLLIERIDIKNKTIFNIQSTLKTVLGDIGCGGWQHILPEILFRYIAESCLQ